MAFCGSHNNRQGLISEISFSPKRKSNKFIGVSVGLFIPHSSSNKPAAEIIMLIPEMTLLANTYIGTSKDDL